MMATMLAGAGGAQARAPEQGWQPIFNGRDLSGWTAKIVGHPAGDNFADTFRVQDGALRVSYDGYQRFEQRFGHLFYKSQYRFFRFRLKYRMLSPHLPDTPGWAISNSGIMFFGQTPETMALDQDFPVSVEFQLRGRVDDKVRPSGSVCTPGTTVEIGGVRKEEHCIESSGPTLKDGQWVEAELDVLPSGDIIHKINGREVLRYRAVELDPADESARPLVAAAGGALPLSRGTISLQSEGHPIEFRDIMIQPLDDLSPAD